ncbi:MAG: peptidase M14 [Planctomycetaceae bacterium]|nr:MAG: peptidase M14 [Planctomycetaceae bacterium]
MTKLVLLVFVLCLAVTRLQAQELPIGLEFPLDGVQRYRDEIPKPESILGHRVGDRHTQPHQIAAYFRAIDQVSDRVHLVQYARSYQGQPLIYAIVTSPANHRRLERIRQQNLRLSEAPDSVNVDRLVDQAAIVYQGYGVHGDESSGPEAAMLLLYHLAAGEGPAVDQVLDQVVLLLDPMLNPDGQQRFVTWVNQNRGALPVADPQNREHRQPWPGGRFNHYWFDANRDWFTVLHPEGQGRLEILNHWRPQIVGDFHEMGSDAHYFFQPGVPSQVNLNIPAQNQQLTADIAQFHARALDRLGTLYYTEESFDDFFPGKGSTYPDVTGGIGILFEQASSRGLRRQTANGELTYAHTVRNQLATSLSLLKAAVQMRPSLLQYQRDFFAERSVLAAQYPVKAHVIGLHPDRTRAQLLVELLQKHRIDVYELKGELEIDGQTFREGSAYVVPLDHPQFRLIKTLMERTLEYQDSTFYDVSTWTLPLAYGLRHAELLDDVAPHLGSVLDPIALDGGRLVGGQAEHAYVMAWGRYFAPRALHKLQAAQIRTRATTRPMTVEVDGRTRTFPRGSIMIATAQQPLSPDDLHALIRQIVNEDHVIVWALDTGLTREGPDLGSHVSLRVLDPPRLALITGDGTTATEAGSIWHLLDQRFGIPVTLLDAAQVRRADLSPYNTLILAGGSYSSLHAETIDTWVRSGGRLIASGNSVDWLVQHELASLEPRPFDEVPFLKDLPYEQLRDARAAQRIGGAILAARLDVTHPIAYGAPATLPLFRRHTSFYEPSTAPGTNVARYPDQPLLSGYMAAEQIERASGSAAVVAQRHGQGRIVVFLDNPNFRSFWYGPNGLLMNAVFFSTLF